MDDSAEHIPTVNRAALDPASVSRRDLLSNPLMRPGMVEIRGVLLQHTVKMSFIQDDHLVEALLTDGANPALGERIRLRCQERW